MDYLPRAHKSDYPDLDGFQMNREFRNLGLQNSTGQLWTPSPESEAPIPA